jgi:hypothetical protein
MFDLVSFDVVHLYLSNASCIVFVIHCWGCQNIRKSIRTCDEDINQLQLIIHVKPHARQ